MNRRSGVLMHISSLWGEYGCGTFGAPARQFVDFLADSGFCYWQVLPFCMADECNSPYKSFSAFSGNPFFIDLETLYRQGLLTKEELHSAVQNQPYIAEFDRLRAERLSLLEKASRRCTEWTAIDAWLKSHPEVDEFCRFMALRQANGDKQWFDWTITQPDDGVYRVWQFVQYIFFTQWAELKSYANSRGISVIGDVPIYVALDSADVWARPEDFQLNGGKPVKVAGVPPDYFNADGQLWGNPLYDWKKMKKDGFPWWRRRLAFMAECFDGIRIDHFRGLESYYAIPADAETAKAGSWEKGPGIAFVKMAREVVGDKLIIAEDLGDVTDEVRTLVKKSGFPGMRVLQFAFLGEEDNCHAPHNYDNNCVAYTGTHDNNTMLGHIWECGDTERKRLFDYVRFEGKDWNLSRDDILSAMLCSAAGLVIFPVQDLLFYGEDTRLNIPGLAKGNWSYRLTMPQLNLIDRARLLELNRRYGRK